MKNVIGPSFLGCVLPAAGGAQTSASTCFSRPHFGSRTKTSPRFYPRLWGTLGSTDCNGHGTPAEWDDTSSLGKETQ